jgi:hypothetical protein
MSTPLLNGWDLMLALLGAMIFVAAVWPRPGG